MAYHVNPETMRPNICKAVIQECQFGSNTKHFDTKKEATVFVEENLQEQLGSFKTLQKSSKRSLNIVAESQTYDKDSPYSLEERLGVIPKEKLHGLIKKNLRNGLTPKETEALLKKHGGYDSVPFYVYYNRNAEMTLDYEDYETENTFTKGACAALASEINRVTGLPLVLFTKDKDSNSSWEGHAVLKIADNEYFDITGTSDRRSYNSVFPGMSKWTEEEVSRDEFNKILNVKEGKGLVDHLPTLEKAALAKICLDLINDYQLNIPGQEGKLKS